MPKQTVSNRDTRCAKACNCSERVVGIIERPYRGEFSEELDFCGTDSYTDVFCNEARWLEWN